MSIATNLKRLMDERDLTSARLSERSGVSKGSIDKYLRGHIKPAAEVLAKLSEGLGCDVEEIEQPTKANLYKRGGNISVSAAAEILEVNEMDVRIGMRNGTMPIGFAEKPPGSTKYKYTIVPDKFWDYFRRQKEAKEQIEAYYAEIA